MTVTRSSSMPTVYGTRKLLGQLNVCWDKLDRAGGARPGTRIGCVSRWPARSRLTPHRRMAVVVRGPADFRMGSPGSLPEQLRTGLELRLEQLAAAIADDVGLQGGACFGQDWVVEATW